MKDMKRKITIQKSGGSDTGIIPDSRHYVNSKGYRVNAATYVKLTDTPSTVTSKKTGWQKIKGDSYFYNLNANQSMEFPTGQLLYNYIQCQTANVSPGG